MPVSSLCFFNKTKETYPERRQNGFIMFPCTSVRSRWVTACLFADFPEQAISNILLASCLRGGNKIRNRTKKKKEHTEAANSNYHKSKWIYYHNSHSYSVFFHISVLGGDALSLSYPSPLPSACQEASQAEQGRRNSGRNETDDSKAEDGEMAVTEWDGAEI